MNATFEPLLPSIGDPAATLRSLTTFWFSGADRFAQLNGYAGLAALDNSTHHFSTLAQSKDFDDVIELHMQSLLPAAESAKAYIGQVLAFCVTTIREFEHVMESQMPSFQD